ncbi:hypothetical protein, partial [Nocardia brasiliensis]|uniref:hypothetical protein n=1 Tax=Nocardia brasiliensis TaxID=37326 RepID=UPI0024573F28
CGGGGGGAVCGLWVGWGVRPPFVGRPRVRAVGARVAGAVAARFLAQLKDLLEQPLRIIA